MLKNETVVNWLNAYGRNGVWSEEGGERKKISEAKVSLEKSELCE